MDDLLREFVTETNESLDVVDVELVRFEQDPNNAKILDNIFRLVHTIKGTCGFLGLPRLEALAHAAETLMGKFRDGAPASRDAVTLILATIDRIKAILDCLEHEEREPEGGDTDLISNLERMVEQVGSAGSPAQPDRTVGTLVPQVLERALRPDEDSLDDLERAFRGTPADPPPAKSKASVSSSAGEAAAKEDEAARAANQSIRVTVDTLQHLMTMVSELVLTRNQLLEIVRRHEESEFKTPLQRLSNVTAEL
jgi:two-component system, chemotaxis family, sensor kinase CheA